MTAVRPGSPADDAGLQPGVVILQADGKLISSAATLKTQIADAIEMHESTVSRVTTRKYMHTPRGIYEFKYFFSSHVSTESGGECSATAIRAIIKKLVAAENPTKPLSDSKMASVLADKGINVARRTIAKYREMLGIPSSSERKRLINT